jgi:hypothetical protein
LWKNFSTDSNTSIRGWKMLAVRSMFRRYGRGRAT